MNQFWDDVITEPHSTRYLVKLNSKDKVNEAIDQSLRLVTDDKAKYKSAVLNFCLHIESSLLYIYPCQRSDLLAEIDVKAMVQFVYKMGEFEAVENKFYDDPKFSKNFIDSFLRDFFSEFGVGILSRLEKTSLKVIFTMYLWDDKKGLYLEEFNIKKYLN